MKLGFDTTAFTKVSDITIPDVFFNRMKTGVKEFDMIFGDGILPGCSATVTAQAGCGKTTLLLQLLEAVSNNDYSVGYSSGEENAFQLAYTCQRLGVKSVSVANETDIDTLAKAMDNLDVLVVDSFQALTTKTKMNSRELEKHAVSTLCKKAKDSECTLIFIMHLTKDGKLKGSTLVPHSVDVNVQIMHDKDSDDETSRIISTYKNRFGGCDLETKILSLDPPNITERKVMESFGLTKGQTYVALRELVDSGKLKKYGRGKSAVWKKTNIVK